MADDNDVGYRKPPKHTRFKKGESGNPNGRTKGTRNFSADLLETLNAPVRIKKNGRQTRVSTQQASLMRLREKALGGDARSLDRLIGLAQTINDTELSLDEHATLDATSQEILDLYFEKRLRSLAEPELTETENVDQATDDK